MRNLDVTDEEWIERALSNLGSHSGFSPSMIVAIALLLNKPAHEVAQAFQKGVAAQHRVFRRINNLPGVTTDG